MAKKEKTPFGKLVEGWGSMARLARESRISVATIRRLVYGQTGHKPNALTVARLAEVMRIEVGKLDRLLRPSWEDVAKQEEEEKRPEILQETVKAVKEAWWKERRPAPFGEEAARQLKAQREKERLEFLERKKLVAKEKNKEGK